ncbi:hypothetical protein ACPU7Y_000550 [Pseudomonas aeruginosa]
MKNHRPTRAAAIATLTISVLVAACSWLGRAVDDAPENATMKPSVTYLHLLRHTPMFTQLDTSQLRWTIEHSREWEARPGTVVAACAADGTGRDDDIWILLDGRWQVEENGRSHPAGHADPGKWFSGAATRSDCRLVTTEKSYVMKIKRADMDDMLARGFAYGQHLRDGEAYYASLFDGATQ